MPRAWDPEEAAELVRQELGLEDDLIVNEVQTAESVGEAINRIEQVMWDSQNALRVLREYKKSMTSKAPKDWTPRGKKRQ